MRRFTVRRAGVRARATVAVALVLVWLCSAVAASASSTRPARLYVALGDSLTQCGSPTQQRYPERLVEVLQQRGIADGLENVGKGGETSTSILAAQLPRALQAIDDPGTDTSVVTVDIGLNDLLLNPICAPYSPSFSLDACLPALDTFSSNYAFVLDGLDRALASDPGPEQVIVLGYYNPWSGRPDHEILAANSALAQLGSDGKVDCAGRGTELGLNDRVVCVAALRGIRTADVYPVFLGKVVQWLPDGLHPNDAGHAVIAAAFAEVLGAPGARNAPRLVVPHTIHVDAASRRGQAVVYDVTSVDDRDPRPGVRCTPRSGATFAIGLTTVRCGAVDDEGNVARAKFKVAVRGPGPQVRRLVDRLDGAGLPGPVARRLRSELGMTSATVATQSHGRARVLLSRFIAAVRRETGSAINPAVATDLITRAKRIRGVLARR
jgi:lysophospholipase L1-like esterase